MQTIQALRPRHFIAAAVVLGSFWSTLARGETSSAGNEPLFERLDADGNGSIAVAEVSGDGQRLFARLIRKADADGDQSLSRDEFLTALVPSRPEKKIETKQPGGYPQADAVRYLLLTMDTSRNSWIEADEVPDDLQPVFEAMAERVDTNKNGTMDRYELSRGTRELAQVAARYVARERIDVAKELKKLDKSQGRLSKRFDEAPGRLLGNLGNPRQARAVFKQFDADTDGKLILAEFPQPAQRQMERFMRIADRDEDGGLSEREFLVAADRFSRAMTRQRPSANGDAKSERKARRPFKALPTDAMPAEEMAAEDK
jgi:Ca2+-binding EF-hand superfamily protein